MMDISLIAAVSDHGVIGDQNRLLWSLPDDFRFFSQTTRGHAVIMGRKTYESIPPKFRPLPDRHNIVISRGTGGDGQATVCASLDAALDLARNAGETEAFVAGGGEIYTLALPLASRLYITRVHTQIQGDTSFPEFSLDQWRLVSCQSHAADERHALAFDFEVYERI